MAEALLRLLDRTPGIDAWRMTERRVEGRELFFLGAQADMRRAKSVRHVNVTVYRDFERAGKRCRGSASVRVHPTHGGRELRRILRQAAGAALWVDNAHYPLVGPEGGGAAPAGPAGPPNLDESLELLARALQDSGEGEGARLNSAELFVENAEVRIRNSEGLDIRFPQRHIYCELIVESDGSAGKVELYKALESRDIGPDALREEVERLQRLCRDRAAAGPTPALGSAPVLLTGEAVREFFAYYLFHTAAESAYTRLARFQPGESVQGAEIQGDALALTLEPFLLHSSCSVPWDEDGWPLATVSLVEAGRLQRYWGPVRFCHYLDIPPTGNVPNLSVRTGSRSLEELRGGSLEVAAFSDFQCDSLTGDFGGELRLAYWTDGEGRRRPVSGGSVSGRIDEVQSNLLLSSETQALDGFQGPWGLRLPGAAVTGG